MRTTIVNWILVGVASFVIGEPVSAAPHSAHYRAVTVEGVEVFYREAGDPANPAVLLLHGFPTSSQMFRNLIPQLADDFYVVAPDYPGFGQSEMPSRSEFEYTFDHLSRVIESFVDEIGLDRFSLYLMDYGAPIGYRLAVRRPDSVAALIVQNGNAYEEGLREFWDPIRKYWNDDLPASRNALRDLLVLDATKWQYTHGVADVSLVSPDTWTTDQYLLDREGNKEIQLDLFYDYRTNVPLYPEWQLYLRETQPPVLIVWGKNDVIFPAEGAEPYKRDVRDIEFHLIDTGHFVLETHALEVGELIADFLRRH